MASLQSSLTSDDISLPHAYTIKSTNNVSNDNLEDNPLQKIKKLKLSNVNRLIIASININSIKGKFDAFKLWVKGNIDIIVVVEIKIDDSFTQQQFAIEGYHLPFRRDRNALGGGVMIFVREDIPVREIFCDNVALNIEGIFVEINLRKKVVTVWWIL